MTTPILLIRHAEQEGLGRLLGGRSPGIGLTEHGRAQATALAERLMHEGISVIQTSPLQRAVQTAAHLAARTECPVETIAALNEVDYGAWTGAAFEDLDRDPRWPDWLAARGNMRPPGGETLAEVQLRVGRHLDVIASRPPAGPVALISHGDVIRAAIAGCIGLHLENAERLEIAPASLSRIVLAGTAWRLVAMNETLRV